MRVTKVMREYVEKQLDEKRYALGKEYRASYDARRKECSDLIKEKVKAFREEIDAILVSYDMDNPAIKREEDGYNPCEVIRFHDNYITNTNEVETHQAYDRKLRSRQKEMLNAFYLECDLGINKEEFLAAVAAMNFD